MKIHTYLHSPFITDIITTDCTKRCSHDKSIHVFVVLVNDHLSNIDISMVIQSVRCILEKYHNSRCEAVFVYKENVNQFISDEGNHNRFHLRDAFLTREIRQLYVWKSNSTQTAETVDDFEGYDSSKCFTDSDCEPLTMEK